MTNGQQQPRPEQIHRWLSEHGWTAESPVPMDPEDGVDFFYRERADDGQEIMVRAPQTIEATPRYPLVVRAVVITAASMEDRPEADVLAEMLATEPAPAPGPPGVPVP